jgi:hypothetical protein
MAYHASQHPDSLACRCMNGAAAVITLDPARVAAVFSQQPCPDEEAVESAPIPSVPEDPVPVDEKSQAGCEHSRIFNRVEGEPLVAEPAEPPAAIVIPEDVPAEQPPAVDHAALNARGEDGAPALIPACAPMPMPYCTEDEDCPEAPMPEETGPDSGQADFSPSYIPGAQPPFEYWFGFFFPWAAKPEHAPAPPACPGGTSDCQEDVHRHEQYPGCPHTGCPATGGCPHCPSTGCPAGGCPHGSSMGCPTGGSCQPCPATAPPAKKGEEEPSDDGKVVHRTYKFKFFKHNGKMDEEEFPRHPEVDTMEYRASDGDVHHYGTGGSL